jgi:hypothetical protein
MLIDSLLSSSQELAAFSQKKKNWRPICRLASSTGTTAISAAPSCRGSARPRWRTSSTRSPGQAAAVQRRHHAEKGSYGRAPSTKALAAVVPAAMALLAATAVGLFALSWRRCRGQKDAGARHRCPRSLAALQERTGLHGHRSRMTHPVPAVSPAWCPDL